MKIPKQIRPTGFYIEIRYGSYNSAHKNHEFPSHLRFYSGGFRRKKDLEAAMKALCAVDTLQFSRRFYVERQRRRAKRFWTGGIAIQ